MVFVTVATLVTRTDNGGARSPCRLRVLVQVALTSSPARVPVRQTKHLPNRSSAVTFSGMNATHAPASLPTAVRHPVPP